jgi:hypothetical protein
VAWTDSDGGRWLPPADCYLPDKACSADGMLAAVLAAEGLPLVAGLPPWLRDAWLARLPGAKTVTPAAARTHLKSRGPDLTLAQSRTEESSAVRILS